MAGKKRMPIDPLESENEESQISDVIDDIVKPEEETAEQELLESAEDIPDEDIINISKKHTEVVNDLKSKNLILRNSAISALTGFIPVPYLDTAAAAATQLQMLGELSKIYGVPFKKELGRKALASVLGAAIPAITAKPISTALNFIPIIGTMRGVLLLSNGAITYALGTAFKIHYQNGGTLKDVNPEKMKNDIRRLYKRGLQTA